MKLHEAAASRNDELKSIFTQALEQAMEKYAEYFDTDEKKEAVRAALTGNKFNVNRTKRDMADAIEAAGVGAGTGVPSEAAQFIIKQCNKLDAELINKKLGR